MEELKTLYVSRKVTNAVEIAKHFRAQGVNVMPASELHVTIIYSRQPVDWFAVPQTWQETVEYPEGGARAMENFGRDAFVLRIPPGELGWRHDQLKEAGASSDYPDFKPHITISNTFDGDPGDVEPWTGRIMLGPEIFEEIEDETARSLI